MAEEVKLFGVRGSPFTCRVEIALKLKGVPFEYIVEDIHNKSPLLLKYNPVHKKVPVLLHNGKPIAESVVIIEYIDQTWKGAPILPEDPYEKAMARFWARFIDEKCMNVLWNACERKEEKVIEEVCELLQKLEDELKGKKFFGGESLGLVDIVAAFIGYWFGLAQVVSGVEIVTKDRFPNLSQWIEEFLSCSVVKESLPPRDRVIGYFRARFQAANASK